jgi:hypothetical protein
MFSSSPGKYRPATVFPGSVDITTLATVGFPQPLARHGDGRVRAADLIGQLGDPHYLRKANALYHEFEEIGLNKQFGYESPADLLDKYPRFYWNSVFPHIQAGIRYLNVTSRGRQWIAGLYSNVFRAERNLHLSGRLVLV